MIYPEDGNSIQAEGAGIIKGAKHRKAAEKFVDFCNDKSFRELVIKDQFRRPARKDLDFSKIVPMPPLSKIKLMPGYVDTDYLKIGIKSWPGSKTSCCGSSNQGNLVGPSDGKIRRPYFFYFREDK